MKFQKYIFIILLALVTCQAASTGPKLQSHASSGPSPIIPASWTVPNWYIDPANSITCAGDNLTGTSATCVGGCVGSTCPSGNGPLLTMAQLVNRWGTIAPTFIVPVTLWFLSDQSSPWTDPISIGNFSFQNSAFGPLGISGTLLTQTTATIGTFTPRNRTAGTFNTITASGQVGAYWAPYVGMLVNDTTVDGWFYIESDLGTATALITEPFRSDQLLPTISPNFNKYVTIGNGDSLTILRPTLINVRTIDSFNGTLFIQHVQFTHNPAGTIVGGSVEVAESISDSNLPSFQSKFNQTTNSPAYFNSYFGSHVLMCSGSFLGGAINPHPAQCAVLCSSEPIAPVTLDGDIVLDDNSAGGNVLNPCSTGFVNIARVGLRTTWDANPGDQLACYIELILSQYGARDSYFWGPGIMAGVNFTFYDFVPVTTATNSMLLTGGFTMDGASTGYPWIPATHSFGAPITITGANIDANGSLVHPGPFGSRYYRNSTTP